MKPETKTKVIQLAVVALALLSIYDAVRKFPWSKKFAGLAKNLMANG